MAIDPSIALQVRTAQVVDPLEGYGRVLSLKNMLQAEQMNQQQLEQSRMQTAQMQRAADEEQAVRGAFQAAGGDARKALPDVMAASPKTGLAIAKQLSEQEKAGLEFKKMRLEHDAKAAEYIGQQLGGVRDQSSYDMARERIAAAGLPVDQMPPMFAPQLVDGYIQKGLSIKDRIDQEWKQLDYNLRKGEGERAERRDARDATRFEAEMPGVRADTTLKQLTAAGEAPIQPAEAARIAQGEKGLALTAQGQKLADDRARAGQAIQMRGQTMADARAAEAAAAARQAAGRPDAGERTAYTFFQRADDAMKELTDLEKKLPMETWGNQAFLQWGGTPMKDGNAQIYKQAQDQFIEAMLRKDSGAAIMPVEYENAARTYFPRFGDTKATIDRKAKARQLVLKSLRDASGRAVGATPAKQPTKDDPLGLF